MISKTSDMPLKDIYQDRIVNPFLFYADVWNRPALNNEKMKAYKQMEQEKQIRLSRIVYNKTNNMVVIEYYSSMPHEWVLDELKRIACRAPEQQSLL